jgi:hypothetical protein
MKRPKTVWLLLVYFSSLVVGAAFTLVGHDSNNEYQVFRAAGLDLLFLALFAAILLLSAATVRAIWSPSATAIRVGIATIVATLVYEGVSLAVCLSNPEAFRAALTAELAARGQVEYAETAFAMATSPSTLAVSAVVTLALAAFGAWLFVWNRPYFHGGASIERA